MKKIIKKSIIVLLIGVTVVISVFALVGCNRDKKRMFETDYFVCIYNEEKTEVTILELTDLGKEQEVLVIPEEINGLPVVQLGGRTEAYPYTKPHCIESNNLKKIYWFANASFDCPIFIGSDYLEIVVQDSVEYTAGGYKWITQALFYVNNISDFKRHYAADWFENNMHAEAPNVFFYLTENQLFYIDAINKDNVYLFPPIPAHENNTFCGWYYEPECINKWNEIYEIPEGQEVLNLYAKWETA